MIRCINKPEKFKNLTLNKEYDATEDGDNYLLLNDAGLTAKYAKKYFVVAPLAPRVQTITEATNVSVGFNDDDEDIIEAVVTIGRHRPVTVSLDIDSTSVSCGVEELSNISVIKRECTALYQRLDHTLHTGTKEDLFAAIITPMINRLLDNIKGCYIMSDAIRDGEEGYNTILDNLSATHWSGLNNNSGNNIILWVFS
jgi:hypothetical protein